MRPGKSSQKRTPEKKSAVPYKNMTENRSARPKSARPVQNLSGRPDSLRKQNCQQKRWP